MNAARAVCVFGEPSRRVAAGGGDGWKGGYGGEGSSESITRRGAKPYCGLAQGETRSISKIHYDGPGALFGFPGETPNSALLSPCPTRTFTARVRRPVSPVSRKVFDDPISSQIATRVRRYRSRAAPPATRPVAFARFRILLGGIDDGGCAIIGRTM